MAPILASTLDPLLVARSVVYRSLSTETSNAALTVHPPCQRREAGPTDVALLQLERWHANSIRQSRNTLEAGTLVVIGPPGRGSSSRELQRQRALLLGSQGCLYAPRFTFGAAPRHATEAAQKLLQHTSQSSPGIALITQDLSLALLHADLLSRWELPVSLIVATAAPQPAFWFSWLEAASRSERIAAVLLALGSAPDPRWLAETALAPSVSIALHLVSDRRSAVAQPNLGHPDRPPDVPDVARALGWTVADSLECAAEAIRLLTHSPRPVRGPVLALGETELHKRIVIQSLHRSGLPADGRKHPDAVEPVSTVVSAGSVQLGPLHERPHLTLTPATEQPNGQVALPAGGTTLNALAALLRAVPQSDTSAAPTDEARRAAIAARQLLATYPALLHEVQVKALLAPFGIASPTERLTTSASAAADAARSIGTPLALKAVGTTLVGRSQWGGVRLDIASVSAARQAFRDILHATRGHDPDAYLDGVLVSQLIEAPVTLDCAIHVLGSLQLVQLQVRCGAAYLGRRQSLRCPLSERDAIDLADLLFGEASRALASHWQAPRKPERHALGAFLVRLCVAGVALANDLRWLRLDTVALPTDGRPALVIDAAAKRYASC